MRKWECSVCGYIHEGDEPPDECPICSADKSMFVELTTQTYPPEQAVSSLHDAPVDAGATGLATAYAFASEQILRHHLHPIMVHTPNGILPMALVFLCITLIFGLPLFETAAFYSYLFVLLNMPLVIVTGYEEWQKRYHGAMTSTFKIKIAASVVTMSLLCILCLWRAVQPEILSTSSTGRWVYMLCACILVGAVGTAGHVGGKLVFATRKN